jgi:hypothetical protein
MLPIEPAQGFWVDRGHTWFSKAHDHYYDATRGTISQEKSRKSAVGQAFQPDGFRISDTAVRLESLTYDKVAPGTHIPVSRNCVWSQNYTRLELAGIEVAKAPVVCLKDLVLVYLITQRP